MAYFSYNNNCTQHYWISLYCENVCNLFPPLPLQPYSGILYVWWDIHATTVHHYEWSMGNCIASTRFMWINIVFLTPLCAFVLLVMSLLLHCLLPHNLCCLLLFPFMCMSYLFIYTYLNFSHIACPPSSVLYMLCLHVSLPNNSTFVYPFLWLLCVCLLFVLHCVIFFLYHYTT